MRAKRHIATGELTAWWEGWVPPPPDEDGYVPPAPADPPVEIEEGYEVVELPYQSTDAMKRALGMNALGKVYRDASGRVRAEPPAAPPLEGIYAQIEAQIAGKPATAPLTVADWQAILEAERGRRRASGS